MAPQLADKLRSLGVRSFNLRHQRCGFTGRGKITIRCHPKRSEGSAAVLVVRPKEVRQESEEVVTGGFYVPPPGYYNFWPYWNLAYTSV